MGTFTFSAIVSSAELVPLTAAEAVAFSEVVFGAGSGVGSVYDVGVAAFFAAVSSVPGAYTRLFPIGILVWRRSWSEMW
jgi:hypothetical protein